MNSPHPTPNKPIQLELEPGKTYAYCTCGQSADSPFCDGRHSGTDFRPHVFQATELKTVSICGCGRTANEPYCDGAHKTCPGE